MQRINKSEVSAFKLQMKPWPRMKPERWNFRDQLEAEGSPSTVLSNNPNPRASQLKAEGYPSTIWSNRQILEHLTFLQHSRCPWTSVLVCKRLLTPLWGCEGGSGGDLALLCLFWTPEKPDFSFVYIMALVVLCFLSSWGWRIWWHHWSVVCSFCSNL